MPTLRDHPEFIRLFRLSEELQSQIPLGLEEVGLRLEDPEKEIDDTWTYDCDPENKITFADTGVDGDHYSFVLLDEIPFEDSPIVMTSPTNFGETYFDDNLIVGENLSEFLALGCSLGYFNLPDLLGEAGIERIESFAWDPDYIHLDDPQDNESFKLLLDHIRSEFSISPWIEYRERLATLQRMFFDKLIIKDCE